MKIFLDSENNYICILFLSHVLCQIKHFQVQVQVQDRIELKFGVQTHGSPQAMWCLYNVSVRGVHLCWRFAARFNHVWKECFSNSYSINIYNILVAMPDRGVTLSYSLLGAKKWSKCIVSNMLLNVFMGQYSQNVCWDVGQTGKAVFYVILSAFLKAMASQITSLAIVYSTVYSGADQRKHQSSASLAFVRGIHRWPVNSPHKWPVTRKMCPFDDVIMGCTVATWPATVRSAADTEMT